jgi:drug/metabolite transporter (DMT)-like permease
VPAAVALLCVVWSSTWYAIRICLEEQPPLASAAARFWIAGAAMALAAPWLRRRERQPPPRAWLWLVVGTLNFAGSYGVLYCAEQVVPSGIAAVLFGLFPLLMAVSGAMFLGERLTARKALGTLVAFAGIVAVFGDGHLGDGFDGGTLPYALLLLISPIVSAIGTTVLKKYGAGASSVLVNRNGMLLGAALLSVLALATEDPMAGNWTGRGLVALAYLALLGTALTFGIYFWLLRTTPASRLALITYVTPILAMLLAAAVGDGVMGSAAWTGAGLVAGGIALVVTGRRHP